MNGGQAIAPSYEFTPRRSRSPRAYFSPATSVLLPGKKSSAYALSPANFPLPAPHVGGLTRGPCKPRRSTTCTLGRPALRHRPAAGCRRCRAACRRPCARSCVSSCGSKTSRACGDATCASSAGSTTEATRTTGWATCCTTSPRPPR
eukprot:scaffold7709_cov62-Phaeocystis_antarctica.AAC.3